MDAKYTFINQVHHGNKQVVPPKNVLLLVPKIILLKVQWYGKTYTKTNKFDPLIKNFDPLIQLSIFPSSCFEYKHTANAFIAVFNNNKFL